MRGLFDDLPDDEAALTSLVAAARSEHVRQELEDTIRRLRRIGRAMETSRSNANPMADVLQRLQRIKALVSTDVTRRSKSRGRRLSKRK